MNEFTDYPTQDWVLVMYQYETIRHHHDSTIVSVQNIHPVILETLCACDIGSTIQSKYPCLDPKIEKFFFVFAFDSILSFIHSALLYGNTDNSSAANTIKQIKKPFIRVFVLFCDLCCVNFFNIAT